MKCQHHGCECEGVESFDGYCSTYCAQADRKQGAGGSRGCACGHPPCGDVKP